MDTCVLHHAVSSLAGPAPGGFGDGGRDGASFVRLCPAVMNIRSASFRDLGRIEELHSAAAASEEAGRGAPTLSDDSPVPGQVLLRLWYGLSKTLSSLVPVTDSDTCLLVAEDQNSAVVGFVQAQGVPGQPKAWHITNLCTETTAHGHFASTPLLVGLCQTGVEHGASRFLVRVPIDHALCTLFLENGFTQYATEQILFRDQHGDGPAPNEGAAVLRTARREDIGAIHLLYLRTTPWQVAGVESPSLKAWQASFLQGAMTRIGRDDWRHLIVERPGVVAWAAIRPAGRVRPTSLALMCDGQDPSLLEDVVDAVVAQVGPGPVSCVLRHYDSELARALQRRGFAVYGTQRLLVRDIAVRVRLRQAREATKPALVHAGLARAGALIPASAVNPPRRTPTSPHR